MAFGNEASTASSSSNQAPRPAAQITREGLVVIIDNFDSFVWNVAQLVGVCGANSEVRRHNVSLAELIALEPSWLVISPGPGSPPKDTGVTIEAIQYFAGKIPILGICLGHQAIGHMYGGQIIRAGKVMHGKPSLICHNGGDLFAGINGSFTAARYHSLVIDRNSVPECLEVTATSESDGEVMAVRHLTIPALHGIQFHPESIITLEGGHGQTIMDNFLNLTIN